MPPNVLFQMFFVDFGQTVACIVIKVTIGSLIGVARHDLSIFRISCQLDPNIKDRQHERNKYEQVKPTLACFEIEPRGKSFSGQLKINRIV